MRSEQCTPGRGTSLLELDVNTFRGDLEFAALDDLDGFNRTVGNSLGVFNLLDNVITLKNLTEHDVLSIEPTRKVY